MATYEITLTEAQDKALSYIASSQQDWISTAVQERCRKATEDIVRICVDKCIETDTQIPGSKDAMVLLAFEQGWVQTLSQVNEDNPPL